MELKQVHKWIDLYFEGQTTLAQEQALNDYFSQPKIEKSLAPYKPYFVAISQERTQRFEGGFNPATNKRRWFSTALAVAASVAFVALFLRPVQPTPEEIVFEEFKANMYLVSTHLNRSKQGVAYMETFNQTTKKFIKTE